MELTSTVNDEVRTHVTLSRPAPGERAAYVRVTSRVIEATGPRDRRTRPSVRARRREPRTESDWS